MANKFHDDSYLVRMFDFIRFFEVPHTSAEAMERFGISRRTFMRTRDALYCAGVELVRLRNASGHAGETNLYKANVTLGF